MQCISCDGYFSMIWRPPGSTRGRSSAASGMYKRRASFSLVASLVVDSGSGEPSEADRKGCKAYSLFVLLGCRSMYVSIASPGPATRCTTCCFHCFTMVSMLHSCREKKNLRQQCRMRSERRNMSYFSHHFGRTLLFPTTTRGEENGGGCHRLDLLHSVRHAVSTASPWCQCCSLVAKRRTCVSSAERVSAVQNAKRATENVVPISPLPDNASQFYLFIYLYD